MRGFAASLTTWSVLAPLALAAGSTDAVAQSASASVWAQIGSATPGIGCWVDASVEVRQGQSGEPVADLDVVIAFHLEGEVYSVRNGITGADGLTYLGFDTSGMPTGREALLDINIGDQYAGSVPVTVQEDAGCNDAPALTELSAAVPLTGASHSADDGWTSGEGEVAAVPLSVPAYQQQRGLSCEFAATSIAMAAFGSDVSEYAFDELVGWSENPHWGFRGDINAGWGGTDDYGVYAEPIARALGSFGFRGDVFYANGDASALTNRIDQGTPVVVWLGMLGDPGFTEYAADGTAFDLAAGEHTVTVYGYDEAGVYASDPGSGTFRFYDWGWFMSMWDVFHGMSLAVGPA